MRILVNAANCTIGGGVQVASSFILNALRAGEHQWRFAVSEQVYHNLHNLVGPARSRLEKVGSPAKIRGAGRARHHLLRMEREFCPDAVYTVFGPAHVRFQALHVCGFAIGWTTHRNSEAFGVLPVKQKFKRVVLLIKDKVALHKDDYYILETEAAREGFIRFTGCPDDHVAVVSNTCAPVYDSARVIPVAFGRTIRLLSLAGYYRHKNLEIIPHVARELKDLDGGREYCFTITLPPDSKGARGIMAEAWRLGVSGMVENRGTVPMKDGPALYNEHDLAFLPTLLETFSAAYPEAMRMERPIVTTDLDFARHTCHDAAIYYSPLSPLAAARAILEVVSQPGTVERLTAAGRRRLRDFPSPGEKFRIQMESIARFVAMAQG